MARFLLNDLVVLKLGFDIILDIVSFVVFSALAGSMTLPGLVKSISQSSEDVETMPEGAARS